MSAGGPVSSEPTFESMMAIVQAHKRIPLDIFYIPPNLSLYMVEQICRMHSERGMDVPDDFFVVNPRYLTPPDQNGG